MKKNSFPFNNFLHNGNFLHTKTTINFKPHFLISGTVAFVRTLPHSQPTFPFSFHFSFISSIHITLSSHRQCFCCHEKKEGNKARQQYSSSIVQLIINNSFIHSSFRPKSFFQQFIFLKKFVGNVKKLKKMSDKVLFGVTNRFIFKIICVT